MSEVNAAQMLNRLGIDAVAWSAELKKRGVVDCDVEPGSIFHGWMCNIIMTAYDRGTLDAGGSPGCSPYWLAGRGDDQK